MYRSLLVYVVTKGTVVALLTTKKGGKQILNLTLFLINEV